MYDMQFELLGHTHRERPDFVNCTITVN